MPTKKTTTKKKTAKITANFSADVPEEIMEGCKGMCKDGLKHKKFHGKGSNGAFYFVGFVGAAIYFISIATSFWIGVLGFLKAIVWPAFLVYGALKYLGM